MKRFFLSLLLSFSCYFFSLATDGQITTGDFTYNLSASGKATICSYIGTDSIIIIPSVIDNYPVTAISGLLNGITTTDKERNVKEIHIPQSVTKITGIITKDLQKLQTVVMGNGEVDLSTTTGCFKITNSIGSFNLRDIIVLSSCSLTSTDLIGSSHASSLIRVNEFPITFQDGQTRTIQMYIYRTTSTLKFTESIFTDLICAFSKHDIDVNTIAQIDLSPIPENLGFSTKFDFGSFDPSSLLPVDAKVITTSETYTSSGYTIADESDFVSPVIDLDSRINYTRSDTKEWNSVCLPFPIKESDFPEGTKIYTFQSVNQNDDVTTIHLSPISADLSLPAGTPCYIYSDAEEWNLVLNSTPLSKDAEPLSTEVSGWRIVGSFTTQTIGEGKYKLNAAGTSFGITTEDKTNPAKVYPYRCYIEPISSNTNAPSRLDIAIDDSNGIEKVKTDSPTETHNTRIFDLFGRPKKAGASGLFIKAK